MERLTLGCSEETTNKKINEIFRKFHSIDNRKHILLYFLTILNEIQNNIAILKIDQNYEQNYEQTTVEPCCEIVKLESELNFISEKTLDMLDHIIIEIQDVVDIYQQLKDREYVSESASRDAIQCGSIQCGSMSVKGLFESRFSSFINNVSSLSTLFLYDSYIIRQVFYKFKLMARELQKIIDFQIQIEVKF